MTLGKFKVYKVMIWYTDILQDVYHNYVSTTIISHNCRFVVFVMGRPWKLYSHSSFQGYNTLSLTIITMLYLRSLGLTHLTPEIKVYTLGPTSPCFPNPSTPGNHHCVLCFYEFNTFRFHLQEILQCLYFFTVFLQWVLMQSLGGNKICTIQRWGNGKA